MLIQHRRQWPHINFCPATPVYIRLQADLKPNNMSLKWIIYCRYGNIREVLIFAGRKNLRIQESRKF